MTQLRRTAATAAAFDLECELLSPDEALERYPILRVDDLVGAIWLPGDGKANPTDLTACPGQGCPSARCPGRRAHARARRADRGRAGHRRPHRRGRHRGRGGRQLRRPVGEGRRRAGRGQRAAALRRALLRRHRPVRGRAPRPAGAARPRRLHLLQGGGRRPRGRRVRAGRQAVGLARRDPLPVRVLAARGGLGALLAADGERRPPGPGARGDRDPQVLQRPGELHPRQPVHPRRGTRGARASSSAPASTRSASPRPAAPVARWRSGSSRASRRWT